MCTGSSSSKHDRQTSKPRHDNRWICERTRSFQMISKLILSPVEFIVCIGIPFVFLTLIVLYFCRPDENKFRKRSCRRGVDRSLAYPKQYPCGWYRICDSNDVAKRGQIKHVAVLGREMIVYRSDDEENRVYVLDAFCVHMGANLGYGGRVLPGTNCIQCPFHLWEFEGEAGRCTKIPYLDGKIPEKVNFLSLINFQFNNIEQFVFFI